MLKKGFSIFAIWILIISCWVVAPVSSGEKSVPWVGILREDGIIIPIGIFHSAKWRTSWPEPDNDGGLINDSGGRRPKTLPLDKVPDKWLSGTKIPRNWILFGPGLDQRKLIAEEATEFESHCSSAWGLKTSFVGKTRTPEGVEPKIKEGLVTSGIAKGWASEIVDPNSSDSKRLLKLLREKFDLAEQEAISKATKPLYTGHPILKNERVYKPFNAKKIFRMKTGRAKQVMYFISIVRQYENPDCPAESLYNVWVLRNDQKYKIVAADMILTNCDGMEGNWICPVGIVSIEGREYVISNELGYEWENYTIRMLDKDALKTVLFVRGGGC